MYKRKRKIFGKILLLFGVLVFICITSASIVFVKATFGTYVDKSKLVIAENNSEIKVYDKNMNELDISGMFSGKIYVKLEDIPKQIKAGFVAVEDKRFYEHNGIDLWRMMGAMVNNIKSGKFSQGASTISQQLIKNTHLTNEKTITRKLKEIKLAYELEKDYSKDEILELYLNNIYFGNGCYGIGRASKFYFDKEPKELTIGEGAMLIGVINAPTYFDPITKQECAENRKNIVLKTMQKNGVINLEEYEKSAKNKENVVKNGSKPANIHINCVLSEICDKLKINENQVKNMNLNIYTSLDNALIESAKNIVASQNLVPKNNKGASPAAGIIVVDNKTKSVVCVASNSKQNLLNLKRQPGSTIKPLVVYAPAFEEGKLYPESIVVDEKININGYSPSNANKKFLGAVSVREAVQKSLNIPAVKTLSNIGVERGKNFAKKLGIEFTKSDTNLALALGGMTEGVTIKQLADAYSTFASGGEFLESSFVNKITDSLGNTIYEKELKTKRVMSEATAYMMTDVLKGVVKDGTARRLCNFDFELAGKTGTVGTLASNQNTDAFNVSYTSEHTIVSWIGSFDDESLLSSGVNGATYPTEISKAVLKKLYENNSPSNFIVPESVVYLDIDTRSLEDGDVELANNFVQNKYKMQAIFNEKHIPSLSKNIDAHKTKLQIEMEEGEKPLLKFETKEENIYKVFRDSSKNNDRQLIFETVGNGETKQYLDASAKSQVIYEYYVVTNSIYREDKTQISNSIKLMSY